MISLVNLLLLSHPRIAPVALLWLSRQLAIRSSFIQRFAGILHWLCMQRVNQAVCSVSPHLPPDALLSDSSGAVLHDSESLNNVRQLYNERFLPRMRQHLQANVQSGPSSSQKPEVLKKVRRFAICQVSTLLAGQRTLCRVLNSGVRMLQN